jgi:hypothetical protein
MWAYKPQINGELRRPHYSAMKYSVCIMPLFWLAAVGAYTVTPGKVPGVRCFTPDNLTGNGVTPDSGGDEYDFNEHSTFRE